MVLTIFRSRLKAGAEEEYRQWAERISRLAATMPGYAAHKIFVAEDGERVTLVEFADEETQRAWARHPEHVAAQKKGREDFYAEYRITVCKPVRDTRYPE